MDRGSGCFTDGELCELAVNFQAGFDLGTPVEPLGGASVLASRLGAIRCPLTYTMGSQRLPLTSSGLRGPDGRQAAKR